MFNLEDFTWVCVGILKQNAPVRDYRVFSKYGPPGNLKNNGINGSATEQEATIVIGGNPAPYGPYTETLSRKPFWIANSVQEMKQRLIMTNGGRID